MSQTRERRDEGRQEFPFWRRKISPVLWKKIPEIAISTTLNYHTYYSVKRKLLLDEAMSFYKHIREMFIIFDLEDFIFIEIISFFLLFGQI